MEQHSFALQDQVVEVFVIEDLERIAVIQRGDRQSSPHTIVSVSVDLSDNCIENIVALEAHD